MPPKPSHSRTGRPRAARSASHPAAETGRNGKRRRAPPPTTSSRTASALFSECERAGIHISRRKPTLREKLEMLLEEKKSAKAAAAAAKRPRREDESSTQAGTSTAAAQPPTEGLRTSEQPSRVDAAEDAIARTDVLPHPATRLLSQANGDSGSPDGQHGPPRVTHFSFLSSRIAPCADAAAASTSYVLSNGCYGVYFALDGSCLQVLRPLPVETEKDETVDKEYVLYINASQHCFIFPTITTESHPASPHEPQQLRDTRVECEQAPQQSESPRTKHYLLIPFALVDKCKALLWTRKWWSQLELSHEKRGHHHHSGSNSHGNDTGGVADGQAAATRTDCRSIVDESRWKGAVHDRPARTRTTSFGFCVAADDSTAAGASERWFIPHVASVDMCSEAGGNGGVRFRVANTLTPYPANAFYGN